VLKNRAIAQKFGSVMFAGLMVLTAGVATAAPASAATDCHSWLNEREVDGPNQFRAGASCTDIDGNSEMRVVLVRELLPDVYGPWVIEGKTSSTDLVVCPAGCDVSLQFRRMP
jgi:hypothetical protein